jgi:hypothetical protein
MDFKRQESRKGPRKERLAYWGNFNYGAIGSALGLSSRELHQAAGLAAVAVNHGRPYTPLGSHYAGDEKRDSDGIDAGINWYRKNYPND